MRSSDVSRLSIWARTDSNLASPWSRGTESAFCSAAQARASAPSTSSSQRYGSSLPGAAVVPCSSVTSAFSVSSGVASSGEPQAVRAVITKPPRIINLAFTVDSSIKPIPSTNRYFTDSARTFEEQIHQPVENREKSPGRTGDGPPRKLGERLEVAVRAGRQ